MLPEGMRKADLPTVKRGGKQPKILSDDKVKVLLNNPEEWYQIATVPQRISGVVANIQNGTQSNIKHLKDKGVFQVRQRKNNETSWIDIYCRFMRKDNI
tara:strand:+ start:133 stop:429 length:297 start_codon:yes stop_codon:yes gene_type:complete